jgi:hypothetical protein
MLHSKHEQDCYLTGKLWGVFLYNHGEGIMVEFSLFQVEEPSGLWGWGHFWFGWDFC